MEAKCTRRIPATEWDSHKTVISNLYVTENKPLDEVIRVMGDHHAFYASKAQYVRKLKQWHLEKNSTKDRWKFVTSQVHKRRLDGKDTEIAINGKLISAKKLKKEMARYASPARATAAEPVALEDDSLAVAVRTPPAEPVVIVETPLIPWFQFQDFLDSHKIWTAGAIMDGIMDVIMDGARTSPLHHARQTPIVVDAGIPHSFSLSDPFMGVPEESNHQLGMSEGLLQPTPTDASNIGPGSHMLDLEQPSASSTIDQINCDARKLLGECLAVRVDANDPQYVHQISTHLDDIALERQSGELVRYIGSLSSGFGMEASLQVLRYAAYLASNNLLSISKTDKILASIIQKEEFWIIEGIASTKFLTAEIFAANLLVSAVRLGKQNAARSLIRRGVQLNILVATDGVVKTSALLEATTIRESALVRQLLDAGADPNLYDSQSNGKTALQIAVTWPNRSPNIADMLIDCGADVNVQLEGCGSCLPTTPLGLVVQGGSVDLAQKMLTAGAHVDNAKGMTALQMAASQGHVEMVEMLIKAGAAIDAPAGKMHAMACREARKECEYDFFRTPLQLAASTSRSEVVHVLLAEGADINCFPARNYFRSLQSDRRNEDIDSEDEDDGIFSLTVLQSAVDADNPTLTRLLLSLGADVDAVGSCGTALQIAAAAEGFELTEFLLAGGADVNAPPVRNFEGMTALQNAALSGDQSMVQLLLTAGAHVNAPPYPYGGRTALQAAVKSRNLALVELLVVLGADVNAPAARTCGRTCLQEAVEAQNEALINYLLRIGANVNGAASINSGKTALQAAVSHEEGFMSASQRFKLVERLLEAGADIRAPRSWYRGVQPLCAALRRKSHDIAHLLLDNGADPNECDGESTPLRISVKASSVDMVRCLIQAGANVNRTVDGEDALQDAALLGNDEMVNILVEVGASLHGWRGTKALTAAVRGNHIRVASLLLAQGAKPNSSEVISSLQEAVARWPTNTDMVQLLLDHGAEIKTDGGHCLQIAARKGNWRTVRMLLASGADVNTAATAESFTALQGAALSTNIDLVQILLDSGADVNAPPGPKNGLTALQAAAQVGNKQMVRLLLSRGADVNAPPSRFHGATALQQAAIRGRLGMTLMLLEAGADINGAPAPEGGRTALEGAAEHGRIDIACLLLRKNESESEQVVQIRAKRAGKLASANGHHILAKLLSAWKRTEGAI